MFAEATAISFCNVAEWAELRLNLSAVNACLVKFVKCRLMQQAKVHKQTQQGQKQHTGDNINGDAVLRCCYDVAMLQYNLKTMRGKVKCGSTNSLKPNRIMIITFIIQNSNSI